MISKIKSISWSQLYKARLYSLIVRTELNSSGHRWLLLYIFKFARLFWVAQRTQQAVME